MDVMTPEDIKRVQQTWAKVLPIRETAAELFYKKLFELDPSLQALFPKDLADQKRKLMMMLNTAVSGLSDLEALVPAVQDLGRRHVGYGVKDEHYPTVGAALLWTLEQGLGDAFTDEVRASWTKVYGVLSSTMMAAAAENAA